MEFTLMPKAPWELVANVAESLFVSVFIDHGKVVFLLSAEFEYG